MSTSSQHLKSASPGTSALTLPLVFRADALITGATGLLMLLGAPWLDDLLDLPGPLLAVGGAILVPYAAFLLFLARQSRVSASVVRLIEGINLAWAVGCLVLLVTDLVDPNALGIAFIIVNIVAVVGFAALQELAHRLATSN